MPFHFGLGPGHLPKGADKIARELGAELVNYIEPNGEKRHWFNAENLGEPFDSDTALKVLAAIAAAKADRKFAKAFTPNKHGEYA